MHRNRFNLEATNAVHFEGIFWIFNGPRLNGLDMASTFAQKDVNEITFLYDIFIVASPVR